MEIKTNKENMELSYEIKKLKAKLNISSDVAKAIDKELLGLKLYENDDLDYIAEKIMTVREGLRDLADFMREEE